MPSLLPVLQILEHMQGGRRVNRRYARRSEDTEQMSVMDWARWNQNAHPELELLHHCPNGGSRNKAEAVKLQQMGVKAGIPDLCLPVPMGMYNGLYIEMKYDTSRIRPLMPGISFRRKTRSFKVWQNFSGVVLWSLSSM